ncbi:hypothetical protein [Alteribacter populi]|uniref:hypothetical protein n=1 Tax=Alteribacter populi TaxID=2011011 RepID=UPI0012FF91FC|nr:hypothetical protein [Alteribacter populi]
MRREIKIILPHHYVWMTDGANDRPRLFRKYIERYLAKSNPELKLIKIEGMTAICEKRG